MRRLIFITLFILTASFVSAQNIRISGFVKERIDKYDRRGNIKENDFEVIDLSDVQVTITTDGKTVTSTTSDLRGHYNLTFLGVGKIYHLEFRKKGYLPKITELDLRTLTAEEVLLLGKWDYGLRKDVDNLSELAIVEKPFERYYYDSKKGELLYDDTYALLYQDEYTQKIIVQVEEVHQEESTEEQANLERQIEKGKEILADAERRARLIMLQAETRGEQLAHAIENRARLEADKIMASAKLKNNQLTNQKQPDETLQNEAPVISRQQVYNEIRDSLLLLANEDPRPGKSKEEVAPITTDKQLQDKKLQLFAKKQQLEIDRLKAITREDSLIIQLREQEIENAALEIQKAENEILHAQNEMQRKEQELQLINAENKNQRNIIVIVSLIAMLVVAVAVFIYNVSKKNQKIATILRDQNRVIASKNDSIMSSIKYAKRIQDAILPHKSVWNEQLPNSFVLYMPKDIVSGDFYWMHPISEHETIYAAVDCTGHGVPGGFMSIVGYHSLHMAVNEKGLTQPADILNEMNRTVNEILRQGFGDHAVKDGMDLALCLLNTKKRTLEYAGAYNPLWVSRDGEMIEIKADKQAVGMFTGKNTPFTNHKVDLQKGDMIYIFSDGYIDQFGGTEGKKIMTRGLRKLLLQHRDLKPNSQKVQLKKYLYEWMNAGEEDQVDDVCVIGVQVS